MRSHSPHLMTTARTRRRVAGLAAAGTLAALVAGPALTGAADASTSGHARAASGALTVGSLAPQRVEADGNIYVPVQNTSGSSLSVRGTASLPGATTAGTGAATVPANSSATVPITLSSAGMTALRAHNWGTAHIHLTFAGTGGSGSTDTTRVVVPTSYVPRLSQNPSNPLAGGTWGNYTGKIEPVTDPSNAQSYVRDTIAQRDALAPIALNPKARWFVSQVPPSQLQGIVHDYVADTTGGNPNTLVQLTMFTIDPWETAAQHAVPTPHQIALDKRYIEAFARGIGNARAAVVIEPDGPFAGEEPHHSQALAKLVKYAVTTLGKLPHTAGYIDMGSADWHRGETGKEWPLLLREGIKQARGFSMDVTHADSTYNQIIHANKLIGILAKHGAAGKHAVIDTSDNGKPFSGDQWQHSHHAGTPISAAPPCTSAKERLCLVAGIPPTTNVASATWHLGARASKLAAKEVDGYLWVKRPWCDPHASGYPFRIKLGLDVVKYSPFF